MNGLRIHHDVVLLQPGTMWIYDPFEHLGLAYLAASLRQRDLDVRIIDGALERWSLEQTLRELDALDIGVLGVTLISHTYPAVVEMLERYAETHPATRIVAGGHFATFAAGKIARHTNVFDAILPGEGDRSLAQYCERTLRGAEETSPPARITDLDALPFPARDCLPLALSRGAVASLAGSRGCYARCAFCTVSKFYGETHGPRWVGRSVPNIIEELGRLRRDAGIRHFMFVDDNFMGPGAKGRERANQFADAYRASGLDMTFHLDCRAADVHDETMANLAAAGLTSVFVGIESLAGADLELYRKDLDVETNREAVRILERRGIDYSLSMIMFNPRTTEEAILENCRFLREADYYPRNPIAILNLYEGTDLLETFRDQTRGPFWDYRFTFRRPEVARIYREALRFCRDTLPLERELSLHPGLYRAWKEEIHRIRLLHLEDLTANIAAENPQLIHDRWWSRLCELKIDAQCGAVR